MSTKKIFVGFAVLALLLGVSFTSVKAQSVTDLQTQIAQLMAQINTLSGGTIPTSGGYDFLVNFGEKSKGADVTALQEILISKDFSIPAGATGYFGSQTKAAVIAWQKSEGINPTGYIGDKSRAALNAMGSTSTDTGVTPPATSGPCSAGQTYNSMTGQPCAGTTLPAGCTSTAGWSPTTGILCSGTVAPVTFPAGCTSATGWSPTTGMSCATVTPGPTPGGVEGSFTITQDANPANNTSVVSNTNTPIYGIKVKAVDSDMTIDRFDLQSSVTVNSSGVNPGTFFSNVSVYDGSTLLVSKSLSSSDFTKDSAGLYYVRITGIGFKVPKGTQKTLTFKVNSTAIGSADYSRVVTFTGYATDNTRGLDTAGFTSHADATWTSSFTFTATNNSVLTGTAKSDSDTSTAQSIAVNATDGAKGVIMQKINLKSTTGDSKLTDLRVYVKTDSVATSDPTSLYLYDGDTLLGSAAVTVASGSGTVNFANMEHLIPKDTTKTLTIKADFPTTGSGVASTTILTNAAETNTTMIETPDGTSKEVSILTAMTGNDVHLRVVDAAIYTLVSSSILPKPGVVSVSSSTLSATIVLNVKADGGTLTKPTAGMFSVWFASSTPAKTTNGGTAYSAANAITVVTPIVTVTPNEATIGDGASYTVTIVGDLISNNALFGAAVGSGYNEFMAIESIDTTMSPTGGSVTDQNWGVDTFVTPSALLTKGTL